MNLKNESFYYYGVDVEYYNNTENCQCGDYCRCGTIQDEEVSQVNFEDVLDRVCHIFNVKSESDVYFIDRILTINKVYDFDNWNVEIEGGYYGEEIEGVYMSNGDKIQEEISEVLKLKTLKDKIFYVLELEYGFVLDKIKNCKDFEIITLKSSDVHLGNKDHYVKIEKIERYSKFKGIKAVCTGYKLIDGYHRILMNQDDEIRVITCQ